MSKGLGKTQQAILDALTEYGSCLTDLAIKVYHPEYVDDRGNYTLDLPYRVVSNSEYASISRSVDGLKQRGLVDVRRNTRHKPGYPRGEQGDARYKIVSVK